MLPRFALALTFTAGAYGCVADWPGPGSKACTGGPCESSSGSSGTDAASGSGSDGSETTASESGTAGMEGRGTTASESTSASGTTASESTSGSTGGPMAECGNGVVEAVGEAPEECDDGNLDGEDGCSASCALDRRVFVTSVQSIGSDVQSLYLADALCANLADDQGWPDGLQYRAWLSDSTTNARDRFKRGRGRLVMPNGLVLAASWSALLAGELETPFEVTELSTTYHGGVWTGTQPDGTAVPGAQHCDDWSSASILKSGHYGYSDRTTPEWTFATDFDQPSPCNSPYALYCFQTL